MRSYSQQQNAVSPTPNTYPSGPCSLRVLHPSTPVGPPCGWPWRSNPLEAWIGPFRGDSTRSTCTIVPRLLTADHPRLLHDRPKILDDQPAGRGPLPADFNLGRRSLRDRGSVTHPPCTLGGAGPRVIASPIRPHPAPSEGDAHERPFRSAPVRQEPRRPAYLVGRGIPCTSAVHG